MLTYMVSDSSLTIDGKYYKVFPLGFVDVDRSFCCKLPLRKVLFKYCRSVWLLLGWYIDSIEHVDG